MPWYKELLALKAEHATVQLNMFFLTRDSIYRNVANTERESKIEGNRIFVCNVSKRESCFLSNSKISPMKYSLLPLKSVCALSVFASTGEVPLWGFGSLEFAWLLHAQEGAAGGSQALLQLCSIYNPCVGPWWLKCCVLNCNVQFI